MKTVNNKKFHDFESLSKAYNELQSEFTRRSQKLRELERELIEKEESSVEKLGQNPSDDKSIPQSCDKSAEQASQNSAETTNGAIVIAAFSEDGDKTTDFSSESREEDSPFDTDISAEENCPSERVTSTTLDADVEQPLAKGSTKDYNDPSSQSLFDEQLKLRLSDPAFIDEVILTDSFITSRIIAAYLTQLSGANVVSTLNGSMGKPFLSPVKRPKNLVEARAIAEQLLK